MSTAKKEMRNKPKALGKQRHTQNRNWKILVLATLVCQRRPMYATEIAELHGHKPNAIYRAIAALESEGLVHGQDKQLSGMWVRLVSIKSYANAMQLLADWAMKRA